MNLQQEIKNTAQVLEKGGLILYPSDTIWGLGCDPYNKEAIEALFHLKGRTKDKHFILLVDSIQMLLNYVQNIPVDIQSSIVKYNEPTTVIYPSSKVKTKELSTTDGSIAFRIVRDEFVSGLIKTFGKPVVSTSANVSGEGNPKNFKSVNELILKGVDYVVNLQQDKEEHIKASKVLKLHDDNTFTVIRE